MAWRTLESEKPAHRQSARYFSSQFFFSVEVYFFSSVSSNALAICWRLPSGQQTSVCRQTPSAYPLSPLSPSTLSPIGPQTGLCESHQLHQRPGLGSNPHPPTSIPAQDTFRSHPPHTAPLCPLNLPPKNLLPSLSGWSLVCRPGLPHILYHLLISHGQWKKYPDSLVLYLPLVKVVIWKKSLQLSPVFKSKSRDY